MSAQQSVDLPKGIVWIASYPKSGNTWLRFLTCNLVFGPIDSAETLARLAPDLHELSAAPELAAGLNFFKTHFPFSSALPLVASTAAAIYVVREPADVMLSNYHYGIRARGLASEDAENFDRYVDGFIDARGDPRWIELKMGTWDQNVHSWIGAQHAFPILKLRYEDLQAQPLRVASAICRFLRLERTEQAIVAAVDAASFDRMRAIEEADIRAQRPGIFFKPYLQKPIEGGLRFMRSGQTGLGERALSSSQALRFEQVFGMARRALGYR